jgi:hypothetical protein
MAAFLDLFAILSLLRGENVSRFKHRVSRSLSKAFETWQVLESRYPDGIDLQPPFARFENPTVSDQSALKFRSLAVRAAT